MSNNLGIKIVYSYNEAGYYLGETLADESPLEPGEFLLPANTTFNKPKEIIEPGYVNRLNFETNEFELEAIVDPVTIDVYRNKALNNINIKTSNNIVKGFISQALGEDYYYKSSTQDQSNLDKIVIANIPSKLRASKDNVTFTELDHTAKQLKQVNVDCVKHITSILSKGREIKDLINAATTVDEIKEIELMLD